jgi:hypothetical protein
VSQKENILLNTENKRIIVVLPGLALLVNIKGSFKNVEKSRVAQWKRAGPITQKSVDRNYALLIFSFFVIHRNWSRRGSMGVINPPPTPKKAKKKTRVISTRKVQFPPTECNFDTYECDYDTL